MAEENETEQQESGDDLVKKLRKEIAERNAQLEAQNEQITSMKKDGLFRDLNIDRTTGAGKLLYDSYAGDLTEEALREKIEEYGLDTSGKQSTQQSSDTSQREQHEAMARAAAGAEGAGKKTDPVKASWEAHEAAFRETGSRDAAMAAYFERLATESAKQT